MCVCVCVFVCVYVCVMDDILQVGVYINTIVSIKKRKKTEHNMHNTMSLFPNMDRVAQKL